MITAWKEDLTQLLFSAKAFAGAMVAYYCALAIDLPRPSWAVITAYIVSQPLAGAARSKGIFRFAGTMTGVVVSIVLVPNLDNAPEMLSLAIALWLGLCTYAGTTDRTARGYTFLLAGYTAAIIGYPSAVVPADVFAIAISRAQEVTIGIVCATLVHSLVMPRSVTASFLAGVEDARKSALIRIRNILNGAAPPVRADRAHLARDIARLNQIAIHLPFDTAAHIPHPKAVQAMLDELATVLVLGSALEDRIRLSEGAGPADAEWRHLLADAADWIAGGACTDAASPLIRRANGFGIAGPHPSWHELVRCNCAHRLAETLERLASCSELDDLLRRPSAPTPGPLAARALSQTRSSSLHADRLAALKGAFTTAIATLAACAFWIATAWPEGGTAPVIAAVVCALFAGQDGAAAIMRRVFAGTCVGIVCAAVYAFAILPRVTEFCVLIAVMAPTYLVVGKIYATPRYGPFALGLLLALPALTGLDTHYDSSFRAFLNNSIAQLAGTGFALVAASLLHPNRSAAAVNTLFRSAWRDLGLVAPRLGQQTPGTWARLTADRIALLDQRLFTHPARDERLTEMLSVLRSGMVIQTLRRQARDQEDRDLERAVLEMTQGFAMSKQSQGRKRELLRRIDAELRRNLDREPQGSKVTALVSMRCNLFGGEEPPAFLRQA